MAANAEGALRTAMEHEYATLTETGEALYSEDDLSSAKEITTRALRVAEALVDRKAVAHCRCRLAEIAVTRHRHLEAAGLLAPLTSKEFAESSVETRARTYEAMVSLALELPSSRANIA
ncbi:MAG: hypothetical protein ABW022_01755, partial [Actinoplanes sp.]